MKLKNNLIISFLASSIIILVLIFFLINHFVTENFQNYIIGNQNIQNEEIIKKLELSYNNSSEIEEIGTKALDIGIILKLEDIDGNIIWNAIDHNNGLCKEMLENRAEEMAKFHNNEKSKYKETYYDIKVNGVIVAKATLGYYGPYYYNSNDIKFLNNINYLLISIFISSLIISTVAAIVVSKKTSKSLEKINNATKDLFNNNYEKIIIDNSNIKEIQELTEQINNLSKKLKEDNDLRERLSADIAHELRTPLAVMKANIEAIIDGVYENNSETLENINDEIKRLTLLIEKLEKNTLKENFEEVDLKEMINRKLTLLNHEINKKHLTVSLKGKATLNANVEDMKSLLFNLINNAIKYSDEKSTIDITLKSSKNMIEFKISNTGVPIPKDEKDKIFERFYRVDNSRTKKTGGQGIGLSICKNIVLKHSGTINVLVDNKKTTFVVELPKKQ